MNTGTLGPSMPAPRTEPISIEEMTLIMKTEEGHSRSTMPCEVCNIGEGGCMKQPPRPGSTAAQMAPENATTQAVVMGPTGVAQVPAAPVVPSSVPADDLHGVLVPSNIVPQAGGLVVLMTREEHRKLLYVMRGGLIMPMEGPALEGCLSRALENAKLGTVQTGANQVAVAMSVEERDHLKQIVQRCGGIGPQDTPGLIRLEKTMALPRLPGE
jgi:hypothetical protein